MLEWIEHNARKAKKGFWITPLPVCSGNVGRKSIREQTLSLSVAHLGVSLYRSQRDANRRLK
jgi:hypothetical protein